MSFFDDPTVKDFFIQVVKRSIGILDNWIATRYGLEKAVKCPSCQCKIVIGKDAELIKANKL